MSIFAPAKRINYISTNLKIMYLDAAKKQEIFEKYGKSNTCLLYTSPRPRDGLKSLMKNSA